MVGFDLIRIEGIEATGAAEEDTPVTGLDAGVRLELFTDKSVVKGKPLHALIGDIFHDATFGGQPERPVVLNDAHNVLARRVKFYLF